MLTGRFKLSLVCISHNCSLQAILEFHRHELSFFLQTIIINKLGAATMHQTSKRPQEYDPEQNGPSSLSCLRVEPSEGSRQ